jgi:hypothetical protein
MKKLVSIVVGILSFISVHAQNDLENFFSEMDSYPSCKNIANTINKDINRIYKNDSINNLLINWERSCGESEPYFRLKIIDKIKNGHNTDSLIQMYYSNYSYTLMNRIEDSKNSEYDKIYRSDAEFYSHIPLRGNFDSLMIHLSNEILEQKSLNKDEKLICLLFSFQSDNFWNLLKKKEFKETAIYTMNQQSVDDWKGPFTYDLILGAWQPLNSGDQVIGLNPQLGVGLGIKYNKLHFNLVMLVRINVNDDDFSIIVGSDTIETNTDIGALVGGVVSYKIYSKDDWTIAPNIGLGWDIIETDVKKSNREEENEYYELSALNVGVGLNVMYKFGFQHTIGLGVNYHYVPYHMDDNYYTGFSTNYSTFNIFYRF